MNPIRIQALVYSPIPGEYLATTTYDLCGNGGSSQEAKRSAAAVVVCHLTPFAMINAELPQPQQLASIDDVARFFSDIVPSGARIVRDETVTERQMGRLPELVFEFYRVESRR